MTFNVSYVECFLPSFAFNDAILTLRLTQIESQFYQFHRIYGIYPI